MKLQKDMIIMLLSMLEGIENNFYFLTYDVYFLLQAMFSMVQVSSFIFLRESPYTFFFLLVGKQMVDTLIESQSNVELLLQFFDIFLKMKGLTTSEAFQEFDTNKDGFISPKEFRRAMEAQKMYTR